MSCFDSVTLGIEAEECPHFTSVLRCKDTTVVQEPTAQESVLSTGNFVVHYVTITASTKLIFKEMTTCSIQQVPVYCQWRSGPQSRVDKKFPFKWDPGSPPRW